MQSPSANPRKRARPHDNSENGNESDYMEHSDSSDDFAPSHKRKKASSSTLFTSHRLLKPPAQTLPRKKKVPAGKRMRGDSQPGGGDGADACDAAKVRSDCSRRLSDR